jgi:hypothetical protein
MADNQACAGLGKLADGANGQVLQIFKKQNRELPYARSAGQAGHVNQNFINIEVPVNGKNFNVMINYLNDR